MSTKQGDLNQTYVDLTVWQNCNTLLALARSHSTKSKFKLARNLSAYMLAFSSLSPPLILLFSSSVSNAVSSRVLASIARLELRHARIIVSESYDDAGVVAGESEDGGETRG